MDNSNFGIIIQARMSSKRLPGKVLFDLNGSKILDNVVNRCSLSNCKNIVIATSLNKTDNLIEEYCKKKSIIVSEVLKITY